MAEPFLKTMRTFKDSTVICEVCHSYCRTKRVGIFFNGDDDPFEYYDLCDSEACTEQLKKDVF